MHDLSLNLPTEQYKLDGNFSSGLYSLQEYALMCFDFYIRMCHA